jgi:hypothetical protein
LRSGWQTQPPMFGKRNSTVQPVVLMLDTCRSVCGAAQCMLGRWRIRFDVLGEYEGQGASMKGVTTR